MKGFDKLNKAFESRVRLGVMSILVVSDWVVYSDLKEKLNLTDGNLASHISALEKAAYIEIKKEFVGKRPRTSYKVSVVGKKAFNSHLAGLESIIRGK